MGRVTVVANLLGITLMVGCTLIEPPGWPAQRRGAATRRVVATPGVMYGYAPLSWELPDGRTLAVDVDELRLVPAARTSEVAFSMAFVDDPSHQIRCTSSLAPRDQGWFRCAGTDAAGQPIRFRLGPGQDCEMSMARHTELYTTPSCWRGVVELGRGTLQLERGYYTRSGIVVGYISWTDNGTPVLAASIVNELQVQIYDGPGSPGESDDDLMLVTLALHWFEQVLDDD